MFTSKQGSYVNLQVAEHKPQTIEKDTISAAGRVLLNKRMIPNYNLKHAIENWCRQHNISLAALAERNVAMAREQSSAAEEMPSVLESDSLSRWATCRLPPAHG